MYPHPVARRSPTVQEATGGEKTTTANNGLTWTFKAGLAIVRTHHIFLSPVVILAVPPLALLNQNLLITIMVALVGLVGMLRGNRTLSTTASLTILSLLVWGKAATSILKTSPPDTAVLLVEFTATLFFMEASFVALTFTGEFSELMEREDALSQALSRRMEDWMSAQLTSQGRISLIVLGISIGLLPVAGIASIPSNQLVFSATLALLAIVVLMFLITHRREPESN